MKADEWLAIQRKDWQKHRAKSQMTLGKMIARLNQLPKDAKIKLGNPHSYRGFYEDLAFETSDEITVSEAITMCLQCNGKIFEGYKGGDFKMNLFTPVWIGNYGHSHDMRLTSINDDATLKLSVFRYD